MDLLTVCATFAIMAVLPPAPFASGWQLVTGPWIFDECDQPPVPERWFWDAEVGVWRRGPRDFLAETPEQMSRDKFTYLTLIEAE